MSELDFTDNGFFILKEDSAISSPIACAFYQYYDYATILMNQLKDQQILGMPFKSKEES